MRRFTLAALSVVALSVGAGQVASAADMAPRGPVYTKAPIAAFDWNGFYAGVSVGGRWARIDETTTLALGAAPTAATASSSFNSSGLRAGVYAGYNYVLSRTFLIGLEGDIAFGRNSATVSPIPGLAVGATATSEDIALRWDGSIRGRLGFLMSPTWLVYGTGGVAFQNMRATLNCSVADCGALLSQQNTTTRSGWTVGGGVEGAIWGRWLLRAEYRYADYGTWSTSFFAGTAVTGAFNQDIKVRTHTALVGLGYKF